MLGISEGELKSIIERAVRRYPPMTERDLDKLPVIIGKDIAEGVARAIEANNKRIEGQLIRAGVKLGI